MSANQCRIRELYLKSDLRMNVFFSKHPTQAHFDGSVVCFTSKFEFEFVDWTTKFD